MVSVMMPVGWGIDVAASVAGGVIKFAVGVGRLGGSEVEVVLLDVFDIGTKVISSVGTASRKDSAFPCGFVRRGLMVGIGCGETVSRPELRPPRQPDSRQARIKNRIKITFFMDYPSFLARSIRISITCLEFFRISK